MLPPPDAQLQSDGSFVQVGTDGYMLRWTQRPDKSWRRPERSRIAHQSLAGYRSAGREVSHSSDDPGTKTLATSNRLSSETSGSSGMQSQSRQAEVTNSGWDNFSAPVAADVDWGTEKQDSKPSRSSPARPATVTAEVGNQAARSNLPKEPTADAVLQADGSFVLRQEDGSSVRWTRRPDGSWRKPEHNRAGWSMSQFGKESTEDSSQRHMPRENATTVDNDFGNDEPRYYKEAVKESVFAQMARHDYPCTNLSPGVCSEGVNDGANNNSCSLDTSDLIRNSLLQQKLASLSIDTADLEKRDKPALVYSGDSIPREPPPESIAQVDGSFVLNQEDGSSVTWTRRPDGSWRKPVHHRSGWGSRKHTEVVEDQRPTNKDFCQEGEKRVGHGHFEASQYLPKAPPPPKYEPPESPPEEAEEQPDGTFLLELEDGSTVRWTKRPNGTWRKPEHKKAGWVGDLEREKYTIPAVRNGENLLMDPDYLRSPRRGPDRHTPERLSAVLTMMKVSGWQ